MEHDLQKSIVKLLRLKGILAFQTDVMDGLKFCKTNGMRMAYIFHHKQMGYIKGQSDLVLVLPNEVVFVEIKNGKAGRQSPEQKKFQKMIESIGHKYLVWRKIEDCEDFLKKCIDVYKK